MWSPKKLYEDIRMISRSEVCFEEHLCHFAILIYGIYLYVILNWKIEKKIEKKVEDSPLSFTAQ